VVIGLLVSGVDAGGRRMPVAPEMIEDRIDEVPVVLPEGLLMLGVDVGGTTRLETPETIGGRGPP